MLHKWPSRIRDRHGYYAHGTAQSGVGQTQYYVGRSGKGGVSLANIDFSWSTAEPNVQDGVIFPVKINTGTVSPSDMFISDVSS